MNRKASIGVIALAASIGTAGVIYFGKPARAELKLPQITSVVVKEVPVFVDAPQHTIVRPAPILIQSVPLAQAAAPTSSPASAQTYVAQAGDTLSELARGLFGKDSKANRDSVVKANPSLQADPNHVVIGGVYEKVATNGAKQASDKIAPEPVTPAAPISVTVADVPAAASEAGPKLQYTAKQGDTVTNLAGALLGSESKSNRDAIVNANSSLQSDADHVEVGKTYGIPAPDGLSAATQPVGTFSTSVSRKTIHPDSDDIIQATAPRNLRYTAKIGDTVTSLAVALLGSDSKANRDAITNTNATLKANPDHVVVGQTYWIPAPVADIQRSR